MNGRNKIRKILLIYITTLYYADTILLDLSGASNGVFL